MLEPEMAWGGLPEAMSVAEGCVVASVSGVLDTCEEDIDFFTKRVDTGLRDRLEALTQQPSLGNGSVFARMSYSEVVLALEARHSVTPFEVVPHWGTDLTSEHERWIAEQHVGGPTFVTDYPEGIKPFYMRMNEDGSTVSCFDLLVPGIGELIGGSAREERLGHLQHRMAKMSLPPLDWYTDLRRYGSVPHAGFGLGFERLILMLTGLNNVRDAIPLPRYPGSCAF